MSRMNKKRPRSCLVLARLIDSEGFTAYTANQVKRYARERLLAQERILKKWEKHRRIFGELIREKGFTEKDRLLLGRFMQMFAAQNFDAGLRVGLGCTLSLAEEAFQAEQEKKR